MGNFLFGYQSQNSVRARRFGGEEESGYGEAATHLYQATIFSVSYCVWDSNIAHSMRTRDLNKKDPHF